MIGVSDVPGGMAEVLLRGAGLSLILLELIILLRRERHSLAGRLAILFGLSIGAYLTCPLFPTVYALPLHLLCFTVAGWFWLFALAWFDDGFRLRWWHGAVLVGLLSLYAWRHLVPDALIGLVDGDAHPALHLASRIAAMCLIVWAIFAAWRGLRDDLVESRRRYRVGFIGIVSLHMTVVVVAEIALRSSSLAVMLNVINLAFIVAELLLILGVSLRLDAGFFPVAQGRSVPVPSPTADDASDPLEQTIRHAMDEERAWLEPGLTIGGLADTVAAPEYRVRRTINQRMGQRNFPQFVNHYRIEEAKRRLRDPAMARLPILTIALDVGFNSLGPFNRAFRAETGMSPAEWRAGAGGITE